MFVTLREIEMLDAVSAPTTTPTGIPESTAPPEKTDTDAMTLIAVVCGVGVLMVLITVFSGVPPAFY